MKGIMRAVRLGAIALVTIGLGACGTSVQPFDDDYYLAPNNDDGRQIGPEHDDDYATTRRHDDTATRDHTDDSNGSLL